MTLDPPIGTQPFTQLKRTPIPSSPPPIYENLCNLWMTSSAPVMREIGAEIDPQITRIFTDWGRGREMRSQLEESQVPSGIGVAAARVLASVRVARP